MTGIASSATPSTSMTAGTRTSRRHIIASAAESTEARTIAARSDRMSITTAAPSETARGPKAARGDLCRHLLRWHRERSRALQLVDLRRVVAEDLLQHLVGVLAERGAALDHRRGRRELDRHADVEPLAALRVV